MPALLPIILTASYVVLAADRVPELNIEPGCKAAVAAAVTPNRDASACKRDELAARDKLKQDWAKYTSGQKTRCVSACRNSAASRAMSSCSPAWKWPRKPASPTPARPAAARKTSAQGFLPGGVL